MDIWAVLGIRETKDKELIKKVYRQKLAKTNPEDDQEGFIRLRNAYEMAMKKAEEIEENIEEKPGVLDSLEMLYRDYKSRINVEKWNQLFNDDDFVSLEKSEESFDILMNFLDNNYNLPREIWKEVVDQFDIIGRKAELSETYSEDYIRFIIDNSMYDTIFNYQLYEGDDDVVDEFIKYYYSLRDCLRNNDVDGQIDLINMMDQLNAKHPYYDILKIEREFRLIRKEDSDFSEEDILEIEKLRERVGVLMEEYPDDAEIIVEYGDFCMDVKKYEEAGEAFSKAVELEPERIEYKKRLAFQKMSSGKYKEAGDMFLELVKDNKYDYQLLDGMARANESYISQLKDEIENVEDKSELLFELAWAYYRSRNFEECVNVLLTFKPEEKRECEYLSLLGRTYLILNKYDEAISSFEKCIEAIEKIPEADEDRKKDKSKYYQTLSFVANCYLRKNDYHKAKEYAEKSINDNNFDLEFSYSIKIEIEYELHNDKECFESCKKLLEIDEYNFVAYKYMSMSALRLEYTREAIDSANKAIRLYPYDVEPYIVKTRIYMWYDMYDDATAVLDNYENLELEHDKVHYYRALICMDNNDYDKAKEYLDIIIDKKDDVDKELLINVYDKRGRCEEKTHLTEESYDNLLNAIGYYTSGYELSNKENKKLLHNMARVKLSLNQIEDSKSDYEQYLAKFGLDIDIAFDYSDLFHRMKLVDKVYELYLQCIEKFIDNNRLKFLLRHFVFIFGALGNIKKAEEVFDKANEIIKDYAPMYANMAGAYDDNEMYEKAELYYKKALDLDVNNSENYYSRYLELLLINNKNPENKEVDWSKAIIKDEELDGVYDYTKMSRFYRVNQEFDKSLYYINKSKIKRRCNNCCFGRCYEMIYEEALVYEAMGDYEKALKCYEEILEILSGDMLIERKIREVKKMISKS